MEINEKLLVIRSSRCLLEYKIWRVLWNFEWLELSPKYFQYKKFVASMWPSVWQAIITWMWQIALICLENELHHLNHLNTIKFCFPKLVSITQYVKSLTSNEGSNFLYTVKQSFCIWVTNVEFYTGAENYTNKFKGSHRLVCKKIANNTFVRLKICKSSITQRSIDILRKK